MKVEKIVSSNIRPIENICGYGQGELRQWFKDHSLPTYRADQVLQWIYQRGATDFSAMTNLAAALREYLAGQFVIGTAKVKEVFECQDGTRKILLAWPDGALTETVLMTQGKRITVCISTQVGCPVQCVFCASGLDGLQRSLTAGEIVEQVMQADDLLVGDQAITNVVVMGMGEPLANYDNTLQAVRIINASWGLNIGARHITISTVGLPDKIRQLAHEPLQVTLAVSLHAGDDALRSQLIPWAQKTPLDSLFSALGYYYQQTHREVTLEYIMLDGVNCLPANAESLIRRAHSVRCNVNLINYNPVEGTDYRPASQATVRDFMDRLSKKGVNVHLRKSQGGDVEAACGQLQRRRK